MTLPGGSPHARARAMQAVSLVERPRACIVHPSEQCAAAAEDSLRIFEAMGDRPRAALSRLLLAVEGVGATPGSRLRHCWTRPTASSPTWTTPWGRAVVAFVRMEIQLKRGTEAAAREAATRAVGLFRALEDGWGLSGVLYHYGYGVQRFGAYADAVPILEEAIEVAAAAGVHNTVQWATADLGLAYLALGRLDEASACFARAGAVSDHVGDHAGRVLGVYAEALLAAQDGDYARAGPLFDNARAGFERLGVWLATGLALAGLADCYLRTGDLDAAGERFEELRRLADTTGEIGLLCLALEGRARIAVATDAAAAAELLAQAAVLRTRYDRPASSPSARRFWPPTRRPASRSGTPPMRRPPGAARRRVRDPSPCSDPSAAEDERLLGRDRGQDVESGGAPGGDGAGEDPARAASRTTARSCWMGTTTAMLEVSPSTVTAALPRPVPRTRPTRTASAATTSASVRTMARSWRRVMPTARSSPISRVRSSMDSARVLAMPIVAMTMVSRSRTVTMPRTWSMACTRPATALP